MGEHKIRRKGPNTPTLVEVRTFLTKRDHDIVMQIAQESDVPLSKFLPTVIGVGIMELLRGLAPPEADTSAPKDASEPVSSPHSAPTSPYAR